ncbi:LpxL/LpxP family acyltransferase [Methylobacterium sp. Gmos1]
MSTAPHIPWTYAQLASLPLVWRRRALRALVAGRRVLSGDKGDGFSATFESVLRLPRREALRRSRQAAHHDIASEIEWCALHRRPIAAIRRDIERVRVADPEVMERVAATGRPVILAPLHMGAYVLGLAALMLRHFPGRPMLVLRQRDDMAMETEVIERLRETGADMRFLTVGNRADFLSAVRYAQKGAVIVTFCDLDASYGAPAEMPMFGLPFRFAFGTDTLARLTGATVVPLATTMDDHGDTITLGRPFEVRGTASEERAHVAGIMRRHIQAAIAARPEQWHLWPMLADYLPSSVTVSDNSPAGGEAPHALAA